MIRKYIMHEWKKNRLLLTLVVIQTIIVMLVLTYILSLLLSRGANYKIEKALFEKNGYVMNVSMFGGRKGDVLLPYTDSKDIEKQLPQTDIQSMYYAQIDFENAGNGKESATIVYDKELAETYTPKLEQGRWLQTTDKNTDEIEVVVAQKDSKYHVGDKLFLHTASGGEKLPEPIPYVIVGILEDGANVIGNNRSGTNYGDFRDYYDTLNRNTMEKDIFFMGKEDLEHNQQKYYPREKQKIEYPLWSITVENLSFVIFENDITSANKKKAEQYIMLNGQYDKKKALAEVKENSLQFIYDETDMLIPILAAFLILALLTILANAAIMIRQNLKLYGIYYINGLSWRQCRQIHFYGICLLELLAFILFGFCMLLGKGTGLLRNKIISVGIWQVLGCLGITVFFALVEGLFSWLLLRKKSAIHVLGRIHK